VITEGEFMMHKLGLAILTCLLIVMVVFGSVVHGGEDYDQPLINAAWRQSLERVQKLLDEGADVNSKTDNGLTALMMASQRNRIDVAKLLLDRGADVNARRNMDWTALMDSAVRGHMKLVKLLLDKGADVHAKTADGRTALKIAEKEGHTQIVELLKAYGAIDYIIPPAIIGDYRCRRLE
jgi:uncharacterized protein